MPAFRLYVPLWVCSCQDQRAYHFQSRMLVEGESWILGSVGKYGYGTESGEGGSNEDTSGSSIDARISGSSIGFLNFTNL